MASGQWPVVGKAIGVPARRAGIAIAAALVTYAFFFQYLPPFSWINVPFDLHGYHYSLLNYAFQASKLGRFPQWDASTYCGIGLAGNIQTELFYPPVWLLFAANAGRDYLSYASVEIFLIAHLWLGFLLCYFWLRGRGLAPLACTLGAGVFAFSGYACLQMQHLGLIAGYAWFPLGFMGIDGAVRRKSWTPLWKTAAASALCLLAGYPPTWFAFAVSLIVYAALISWPAAVGAIAAIVFSLLLSAVQLLPAAESTAFMLRQDRYGTGIKDPAYYLSMLVPNYYNFSRNVPVLTNFGKDYLYLGAPALFGLAWVFTRRRFREVVPLFGMLLVAAIFLTNPYNLVWDLIQHSKLLSAVCRDWYFLAAVWFALAVLAAFGIDEFLSRPARALPWWMALAGIAIAARGIAWEIVKLRRDALPFGLKSIYPAAIALLLVAALFFLLRTQKGAWRAALAITVVATAAVDYSVYGTGKRFNAAPGDGEPDFTTSHFPELEPEVFKELKSNSEYRVLLEGGPGPVELRQTGLLTPQGYDPFIPDQYRQLLADKAAFSTDRRFDIDLERKDVLQLLGVRYVVSTERHPVYARMAGDPDFRVLGKGGVYYRAFEYRNAVPPFGWETPAPSSRADLVSWFPAERNFQISSTSGGRFVFKEQFLPGWEALLDGKSTPIERWNTAFQAVIVPAGEHRLEFRFRSQPLRHGAFISGVALVALFLILLVHRFLRH